MERDFLGLSFKEPLAMVKDEEVTTEGSQGIGFSKGLVNPWPFTNKVSAVPHVLSFKVAQDEKTKKIVSDPSASSAFMSFSNASNIYHPSKTRAVTEVQKSPSNIMQDRGHFSLNAYSMQQDVQSMHRSPVTTNHAISISMGSPAGNPFFTQSQYSSSNQGMASTVIKPQVLGGVPIGAQHSTLPSPAVGNGIKFPGSGAQLTIFYAGMVNVYDGLSPEKAQAIMLLAGNGSSPSSNTAQPTTVEVPAPPPKPVSVNNFTPVNQSITASPCSCQSSPISMSSNTGAHSRSGSTSTEEVAPAKTTIVAATPVGKLEPSTMMPSVPQARKASLARFLEKRKERVSSVSPYNIVKKSIDSAHLAASKVNAAATYAARVTTISFFGRQGN